MFSGGRESTITKSIPKGKCNKFIKQSWYDLEGDETVCTFIYNACVVLRGDDWKADGRFNV